MNIETKFDFEDEVRDTVTGFVGIIVGVSLYTNKSVRYEVQPAIGKDNKFVDSQWLDELHLEIV